MTYSTWLIVAIGCLLGAIQLTAGIAIGFWLRRGDKAAARRGQQEMLDANRITQQLKALAGEVSSSVGEHQVRIEKASKLLSSEAESNDSITELVVDVIGGIVRANQNLQTKLETAEHRLQEQAVEIEAHISRSLTDPLTGLPNRREFNARLEDRMAGWQRRGEAFSLLMLDVDHFKDLNDQHGHLAGDLVLTSLGRALRSILRRDDAVARYGGEEFAMLLPGTPLEQAMIVAPKVCDTINRVSVRHGDVRLNVTLSGGLATILPGESAESLIGRADAALYAAKSAGRNNVFVHDGSKCRPIVPANSSPPPKSEKTSKNVAAAVATAPTVGQPTQGVPTSASAAIAESHFHDEPISAELALACEELRDFVRQRAAESHEESPVLAAR